MHIKTTEKVLYTVAGRGLVLIGTASFLGGLWVISAGFELGWKYRGLNDQPIIQVTLPAAVARRVAVVKAARRWGVSDTLALQISLVENWSSDPFARNPSGAFGIMQVMPQYWMGVFHEECRDSDLTDINTNACYGVLILKGYLEECGGNQDCALAKYGGARSSGKAHIYTALVKARGSEATAALRYRE